MRSFLSLLKCPINIDTAKRGKRKVKGVPQSHALALPRHLEEWNNLTQLSINTAIFESFKMSLNIDSAKIGKRKVQGVPQSRCSPSQTPRGRGTK